MGKAARNEDHKLSAAFYNNLSVGLALGGILIPYLALTQRGFEIKEWLMPVLLGTRALTSEDIQRILVAVFPFFLAFYGVYNFRRLAGERISKVED
jgi:hypothetical protein